jgi:hypothetical protein
MMTIEAPWFCIMIRGVIELFSCLNVKITTFELEKTTFVVYLIVLSPNAKRKNKEGKIAQKNIFLHLFILQDCEVMEFVC